MTPIPSRRSLVLALLLGSACVATVVAADPPLGDWPTQGGDMGRSGVVAGSVATRRAQVAWASDLMAPGSSPAVVGGRVYYSERIFYGTGDTAIACRDARSGVLLWRRVLPVSDAVTPPTVIDGRVIFTRLSSNTSQVMSLRAADGASDWFAPISAQFERYGAPCVSEGRVVSGGGSYSGLYGFGESAGTPLFFNSSLPYIDGWTPSAVPGGVLTWVGGALRRHNAVGAVERSVVLDDNADHNFQQAEWVAVNAEHAVMTSSLGLYSVHPGTFARQWSVAGGDFSGSPVLAGDAVFVHAGAVIQRRAAGTGALLASSPDVGAVAYGDAAWLIASADAVVASSGTTTWILDRTTLAVRQRLPIGGHVVLADGALFVMDALQPRLLRLDLLDAALDPAATFAVARNGVPVVEGATVAGDLDVIVTIRNAIGQHAQVYGNFLVLQAMGHDEMIPTSPWTTTLRVDSRRFFDGENLLSVHVHPHNEHEGRYTTDFTFATFKLTTANGLPTPNGDRLLPQFHPNPYGTLGVQPVPAYGNLTWPAIRGNAWMDDDGADGQRRLTQIIPHLGTSVLGRWHTDAGEFPASDADLINGVDARPFMGTQPRIARVVYFLSDGAGRANYATENFLLPAATPADEQELPLPLMHGHLLNLADGDDLVGDDTTGFTAWVKVVTPLPHADRYRSLTLWLGNRAMAAVRMQPYLDAIPSGGTSCLVPVVIPAETIADLLSERPAGASSRAMALWLDFNEGDLQAQVETRHLSNADHLHLNSVRLASTPWPWGPATVAITSPYADESVAVQPLTLRYRTSGDLTGATRALVVIDGGAPVSDAGFDGVMPLPALVRGAHTVAVTLADAVGVPLAAPSASAQVAFVIANQAPLGTGDGWRTPAGTPLSVSAATGVLANDRDPDGEALSAVLGDLPQHGTLALAANGSFTYRPQAGFAGVDHFTYRASDGTATSAPLVAVLLVGCDGRSGVTGGWSTLGNGPGHAGRISGSLGGRQPVQAWSYTPSVAGTIVAPVIAGGRLHLGVAAYNSGDVSGYATLNLDSGAVLWRHDYGLGTYLFPPTVDGGRVYAQFSGRLCALDTGTGATVWETSSTSQMFNHLAPCVAEGKLFINGGSYGGISGFRQSDGAELFFDWLEQVDGWAATWQEGRLYTHVGDHLRRHDTATGLRLGDVALDRSVSLSDPLPAVASEDRLVVASDVALAVHDPLTLARCWRVYGQGRYRVMPAVADGLVYAPLAAGGLEIRSLADGTLQRTLAFAEVAIGQPILTDDLVIVADLQTTRALDRASGQTRWTLLVGGQLSLGQDHLCVNSLVSPAHVVCYRLPATNAAPLAVADAVGTGEDTALTIASATLLANDSDADGNALTVRIATPPTRGTLTAVSGGFVYQPAPDASGLDSFTYVANDGLLDSAPAMVSIAVAAVEDPLVAYKPGLRAEFFDYTSALSAIPALAGRVPNLVRSDAQIAYASTSAAWPGLPASMTDTFASRHSGWLKVDAAGTYVLSLTSSDGSRLFLDGSLAIANDGVHAMQERTVTRTLAVGYHRLQIEFFDNAAAAGLEFRWTGPGIGRQLVPAGALWQAGDPPLYQTGLRAEFFDYTTSLTAIPDLGARVPDVVRSDAQIAYASTGSAWPGLPAGMADTFASRHSGWLKVDTAGSYTLSIGSDDGSRVYLNGALLINNDGLHGMQERSATLTLAAGFHQLRVEFFEGTGGAGLELRWAGPGIAKQLVPASALWQTPPGAVGVPPPWTTLEVGAAGIAGSANGNGSDFTISGGGADIWGTTDAFRLVQRPLTGNGELIARVAWLQNTNAWAKAGVMVRASTAAGSVDAFMAITPGNGATFQSRTTTGGATTSATSAGKVAPHWLRLVRSGSVVSGWISPDGVTWSPVGTAVTLPLGSTPVIGLGVCAHDNAVRATAIFDQVLWIPYAGG